MNKPVMMKQGAKFFSFEDLDTALKSFAAETFSVWRVDVWKASICSNVIMSVILF